MCMLQHKHRHRFHRFLLFFFLCFFASCGTLQAEEITQEYQLKAAFLVNFLRFITWPDQSFSPGRQDFTLCVAGNNPFGSTLHAIEGQKINGRNLRIFSADSLQKLPQCHLLYISRSEKIDLDALLSRTAQQPVVTVSDIPGFVTSGGSIEFIIKEDRLSFVINHSVLKKRGIQASASMLDLAASVY